MFDREITTYEELKKANALAKKGNFQPIQILEVHESNKGKVLNRTDLANDYIVTSEGRALRIEGVLGSIQWGMNAFTNPSKLANWRGWAILSKYK